MGIVKLKQKLLHGNIKKMPFSTPLGPQFPNVCVENLNFQSQALYCSKDHCVKISWKSVNCNKSYCTETMCLQTDDDNNLAPFDPLYLGNGKRYIKSVRILPKDILIRSLKKKPHQNRTKNKRSIPRSTKLPILAHLGLQFPN